MEGGCSSFITIREQLLIIFQEGLVKSFLFLSIFLSEISNIATQLVRQFTHLTDKKRCDLCGRLALGQGFDTNVIMYEYLKITVSITILLCVQPPEIFYLGLLKMGSDIWEV